MNKILTAALVAVFAFAPINVMAADLPATSADVAGEPTMTPADMADMLDAIAAFGRNFAKPLQLGEPMAAAVAENPRAEFFKALPDFLREVHTIVLVDGHVTQYPLDASDTSLVMVIGNETHDLTNWFAPFPTSPYTLPAVNGFAPLTIELPDEAAILIRVAPADGMDCLQQVFKRFDFPRTDGSGMDTVSVQKCI